MNEDIDALISNYNDIISKDASVTKRVNEIIQRKNELMQKNLDMIADYLDGIVKKIGDLKIGFYFEVADTPYPKGYFDCNTEGETWRISPSAGRCISRKDFHPKHTTAVELVRYWLQIRKALDVALREYLKKLIQCKVDEQQEWIQNAEQACNAMENFKL